MADSPRPTPRDFYRTMRLIRRFEERSIELVRSGDIGSGIHPCIGQEAVAVGLGATLRPDDVLMANHRGHGHLLAKGTDPGRLLAEMAGRADGVARGRGGSFHPSDFTTGVFASPGTVGHGVALTAGVAWALAAGGTDRVAVSVVGDGGINQGALLEGLNLAALWRVPAVFVCENNQYATTVPVEVATAGSITGRAEAFGIPAVSVDGMEVDEVWTAAAAAVARARDGRGPSFLEFRTYRYYGHHTFELKDRLGYREDAEIERWRARDPLPRQAALVPDAERAAIDAGVEAELDRAVDFALASEKLAPADALAYHYAEKVPIRTGTAPSRTAGPWSGTPVTAGVADA